MRSNIYLDERQIKRRRRVLKLKIYGGLILFFALIIGAGYLTTYSSLFQIKNIQIDADNKQINTDEIIDNLKNFFASQSEIASFLGPKNILIWNNNKIDQFPKNAKIAEIKIEKDYIERQIKITVQEREGFGIWCETKTDNQELITNNCLWFDKNGIVFSEAPSIKGNLINKVNDFSGRSFSVGELVLEEKLISNLVKIFEVLENSNLGIRSLNLEKLEFQEVVSESSPKIYFSLRIDPQFTLTAINSLKNIGLEKIEYIDLRVENRVYYKLKK